MTNALPPQGHPSGETPASPPAETSAPTPDPNKRVCPSCNAQNALDSSFCWQCLTPLGASGAGFHSGGASSGPGSGGTAPVGPPTLPSVSPSASSGPLGRPSSSQFGGNTYENRQPVTNDLDSVVPMPASKPRSPVMNVVRIVLPLIAAVAGFYLGYRLLAGGVSLPDEVAGIPRLEDAASTQITDLLEDAFVNLGVDAKVGLYGEENAAGPSVLLLVVDDVPPEDPELQFSRFAAGLTQSGAGSIDPGDIQRRDFGGVAYLCAPTNTEVQAVCMWQFDNRLGFVGSYDRDLSGTFQITVSAQNAISG